MVYELWIDYRHFDSYDSPDGWTTEGYYETEMVAVARAESIVSGLSRWKVKGYSVIELPGKVVRVNQ